MFWLGMLTLYFLIGILALALAFSVDKPWRKSGHRDNFWHDYGWILESPILVILWPIYILSVLSEK